MRREGVAKEGYSAGEKLVKGELGVMDESRPIDLALRSQMERLPPLGKRLIHSAAFFTC